MRCEWKYPWVCLKWCFIENTELFSQTNLLVLMAAGYTNNDLVAIHKAMITGLAQSVRKQLESTNKSHPCSAKSSDIEFDRNSWRSWRLLDWHYMLLAIASLDSENLGAMLLSFTTIIVFTRSSDFQIVGTKVWKVWRSLPIQKCFITQWNHKIFCDTQHTYNSRTWNWKPIIHFSVI